MRALILGATGQLGRHLVELSPAGVELVTPRRAELDLRDLSRLRNLVSAIGADVLINAAGYTAVDKAESDKQEALVVNALAPEVLAAAAENSGAMLVHLSTDYVFSGQSCSPYPTDAPRTPINTYGQTKAEGEERVLRAGARSALLIRTSWLYSASGTNFVLTMLRLMRAGKQLRIVHDQTGCPTWARGLAAAIWSAVAMGSRGVAHWCDAGETTWYGFASEIQRIALDLGMLREPVDLVPVTTAERPTIARRPPYSVLDTSTAVSAFGFQPNPWRISLTRLLEQLRAA